MTIRSTTEHMDLAAAASRVRELGDWLARRANEDRMQRGRIPERLSRASVLLDDAYDLVAAARREMDGSNSPTENATAIK